MPQCRAAGPQCDQKVNNGFCAEAVYRNANSCSSVNDLIHAGINDSTPSSHPEHNSLEPQSSVDPEELPHKLSVCTYLRVGAPPELGKILAHGADTV